MSEELKVTQSEESTNDTSVVKPSRRGRKPKVESADIASSTSSQQSDKTTQSLQDSKMTKPETQIPISVESKNSKNDEYIKLNKPISFFRIPKQSGFVGSIQSSIQIIQVLDSSYVEVYAFLPELGRTHGFVLRRDIDL